VTLFDLPSLPAPRRMTFDGDTYEARHDQARLARQTQVVFDVMSDGRWRTLSELAGEAGGIPEASASARLRDMRKRKFGGHTVERRRRGEAAKGLFEYRMVG
jgi:hypothetical protein